MVIMESDNVITEKTELEDAEPIENNKIEEILEENKEQEKEQEETLVIEDIQQEEIVEEKLEDETTEVSEEIETLEPVEEIIEKRELRDVVVPVDDSIMIETGIEIKYTSLQLKKFPIQYSNFSKELSFSEVISVGTSSVKIGDYILNNASLKILVYDKFKLLEIKTREFKIGLSIDLINSETLVKNGDFYKYEIFNKIKTSRFYEVINILKEIFKGTKIEFKYKKLEGEISFENRIEVYKFTVLEELVNSYGEIISKLSLNREKNIVEVTNDFYEIFLTEYILKSEKFDSWVNLRMKNSYDIESGDRLTFERIHKLNFKGINFDIKEIIKIKDEVSQREITQDNEICSYRKTAEVSLVKVEKIN